MNLYLVHLHMQIGEYEKTRRTLVYAPDPATARTVAIMAECHNEPDWEDDDRDSAWDDVMFYTAGSVDKVHPNDIPALTRYFPTFSMEDLDNG